MRMMRMIRIQALRVQVMFLDEPVSRLIFPDLELRVSPLANIGDNHTQPRAS